MNILMEKNSDFINLQLFFEKPSYIYKTLKNSELEYSDYKLLQLCIRLYRFKDVEDFQFSTIQEIYYQKLWVDGCLVLTKHVAAFLKLQEKNCLQYNYTKKEVINSVIAEVVLILKEKHNFNIIPNININTILRTYFNSNFVPKILYAAKVDNYLQLKNIKNNVITLDIDDAVTQSLPALSSFDDSYLKYEEREFLEKKLQLKKYKKDLSKDKKIDVRKVLNDNIFF